MRQRQPNRAQLRKARLMGIKDAARNVKVRNRVAIVEHGSVLPTPSHCR
jgi:hypothetical protein